MTVMQYVFAVLLAGTMVTRANDTGIDPAQTYAWGENVGWANASPTNAGATVLYDGASGFLTDYLWAENIGWINLGSSGGGPYENTTSDNWGVNLAANGDLSGFAWGENIGWINFGYTNRDAAINLTNGKFSGHVWGENIGWLTFRGSSPDYGVRTIAFDTQAQGTPNWWLNDHGVTEAYDDGDGFPAWQEYVTDTDPRNASNFLHITEISNTPTASEILFTPASTRRYYTLVRRNNLMQGGWSNVVGQVSVQYGSAGEMMLQDTNAAACIFYSVEATVEP